MRRFFVVAAVLLASIIGFAAEPTTSTEADRHEGRAYAGVVHTRDRVQTPTAASPLPARTVAALVAVLCVLAMSVGTTTMLSTSRAGTARDAMGRLASARRGPPATA